MRNWVALIVCVVVGVGCVASVYLWFISNTQACFFAKGVRAATPEVGAAGDVLRGYGFMGGLPSVGDYYSCFVIGEKL